MITKKIGYLASTAIVASLAFSGNAFAQAGGDEIIVTSTKRETTLQATPVAVTVTSADTIEKARILDLQDLQAVVPTLRVNQLQTSQNVNFSIRGFGNGANNAGIEPSVGVFIDGVYRSRSAAQIGDLPKLERVEVLAGPQSTLFGKNASAGVVSIATAAPKFETEGYVEAGFGRFNEVLVRGYATTGISENVAVSLGGGYNSRDGMFESVTGNSDVNEKNRWNIRGQALIEPSDNTSIRLIADYSKIDEVCCAVTNIQNEGAANAILFLGGQIMDANDPFALTSVYDSDPINTVDDYGFSMHIDHDFDNFALTSISSYRSNESFYDQDADYSSLDTLRALSDQGIDTITQELRLTSTGDNQLDWMVGGYYFSEDIEQVGGLEYGADVRNYIDLLAGGALSLLEGLYGETPGTYYGDQVRTIETFTQDNTAWSIFGTADFHVNDKLTLTGGLNYTNDDKTVTGSTDNNEFFSDIDFDTQLTVFGAPLAPVLFADSFTTATGLAATPGNIAFIESVAPGTSAAINAGVAAAIEGLRGLQFQPQFVDFPNSVESGKTSDSKLTWTARAAYELNDNVNVYASAATGFKSSSWNLSRDSRPHPTDAAGLTSAGLTQNNQTFGTRFASPESVLVYELGLKARFDKGSFNLAIFDQSFDDFQSNAFVGGGFVLTNAGKSSVRGAEIGAKYRATDNLTVGFDAILLDPVFDSFPGATGPGTNAGNVSIDRSGERVSGIPGFGFSTFFDYDREISDNMTGYIHVDYQHENEVTISSVLPTLERAQSNAITREINLVNASIGVKMDNGLAVQLWSRNLFGDEFLRTIFPGVAATGVVNAYRNTPTTYGVNVRKTF
jgi:outer membrane receptor protein involved in Fe transport